MAIGRISGSVLKSNLIRNGTDLAFETDLLYLDVTNSRIGIGESSPSTTLDVDGTITGTTVTAGTSLSVGDIAVVASTNAITGVSSITLDNSTAPAANATLSNKKYVDDSVAAVSTTAITSGTTNVTVAATKATVTASGTVAATFDSATTRIHGNLTVDGTTTTINTTNTSIEDPIMELSRNNSGPSDIDSGIMINRGASNNAAIYWNEGDDVFKAVTTTSAANATAITDTAFADFQVKDLTAASLAVTGASTLDQVTVTDNTISSNASNANLEINANGSGTVVLENLKVGTSGSTVTTILDEDAMGTDSATSLATQQSIKAYVDAVSTLSLIDEDDMSTDSATRPPSQQSVKAYVDGQTHLSLIDEDNMATDSATRPPSQQSVKAYVDGQTHDSGIDDIVEDTTPQLGGDLDLNGNNIDFPTTANISDCLDEDTMSSDSATKLATQQSIKAYADTKASAGDIVSLAIALG